MADPPAHRALVGIWLLGRPTPAVTVSPPICFFTPATVITRYSGRSNRSVSFGRLVRLLGQVEESLGRLPGHDPPDDVAVQVGDVDAPVVPHGQPVRPVEAGPGLVGRILAATHRAAGRHRGQGDARAVGARFRREARIELAVPPPAVVGQGLGGRRAVTGAGEVEEHAVGVDHLDPQVVAVGDVDLSLRADGDADRTVEVGELGLLALAGSCHRAPRAPRRRRCTRRDRAAAPGSPCGRRCTACRPGRAPGGSARAGTRPWPGSR